MWTSLCMGGCMARWAWSLWTHREANVECALHPDPVCLCRAMRFMAWGYTVLHGARVASRGKQQRFGPPS